MNTESVRVLTPANLYPEYKAASDLANTKIKAMDTAMLSHALMLEMQSKSFGDQMQVAAAIEIADYIHADQTRDNAHAYIEHPLRNALRIARYYGCQDPDVIIAALLHDSVEDRPERILELAEYELFPIDVEERRRLALQELTNFFNSDVSDMVSKLTTPESAKSKTISKGERNKRYHEHVDQIIQDPRVFIIKLSDWEDNGISLKNMDESDRKLALATKYLPLASSFKEHFYTHLNNGSLPAPSSRYKYMVSKILRGEAVLSGILNS